MSIGFVCIYICICREILGAGLYFAVRGSWCRVPTRVLRWFAACQGRGPGPPLFWSTTQPFTFRPFYFAFCYLPFVLLLFWNPTSSYTQFIVTLTFGLQKFYFLLFLIIMPSAVLASLLVFHDKNILQTVCVAIK